MSGSGRWPIPAVAQAAAAGRLGRSRSICTKGCPDECESQVASGRRPGWGCSSWRFLGGGQKAWALTPESPAVKAAIEKAVAFLESPAANDGRVGAQALVGLVFLKNHADPKHPRIVEAVAAIQGAVKGHDPAQVNLDIYSAGLAIIFLVTLDPSAYSSEISVLLEYLKLKQKPHGGWGYPEKETGDTSMTQYGVLSAWEATQAGFKIPPESIEAVTTWLLKTQDPSGGFGYQGTVSKTSGLVKQNEVRHSMAAAGLGSLYICADLLGLVPRAEKRDEDLPSALHEVKGQPPPAAAGPNPKTKIDPRRVKDAEARGNRWLGGHYDMRRKEWWTFYYLYAYERYASFRELSEGQVGPGTQVVYRRRPLPASHSSDRRKLDHGEEPRGHYGRHGVWHPVPPAVFQEEHREGLRLRRQHVGGRPGPAQGDGQRAGRRRQGAGGAEVDHGRGVAAHPPETRRPPPSSKASRPWASCRRPRPKSWRRKTRTSCGGWLPTARRRRASPPCGRSATARISTWCPG